MEGILLKKQTSKGGLDIDVDLFKELQKFQKKTNKFVKISKGTKGDPNDIDAANTKGKK